MSIKKNSVEKTNLEKCYINNTQYNLTPISNYSSRSVKNSYYTNHQLRKTSDQLNYNIKYQLNPYSDNNIPRANESIILPKPGNNFFNQSNQNIDNLTHNFNSFKGGNDTQNMSNYNILFNNIYQCNNAPAKVVKDSDYCCFKNSNTNLLDFKYNNYCVCSQCKSNEGSYLYNMVFLAIDTNASPEIKYLSQRSIYRSNLMQENKTSSYKRKIDYNTFKDIPTSFGTVNSSTVEYYNMLKSLSGSKFTECSLLCPINDYLGENL